jgi:hypothetical protein
MQPTISDWFDADGFTIRPAMPTTENYSWIVHELKPGDTITDSVIFTNGFDYPIDLRIYAVDVTEESTTENYIKKDLNDDQFSIGEWITFENGEHYLDIPLGAGESGTESFTITIPEDTSLGEHWGVVFGSFVYPGESGVKESDTVGIGSVLEVGVRVLLTITETPRSFEPLDIAAKTVEFSNKKLSYIGSSFIITFVSILALFFYRKKTSLSS